MKAYRLLEPGPSGLRCVHEEPPRPGAGEVLVRLAAASINARDLGILHGVYPNTPGVIPLSDGAGTVEAVGAGVQGFAAGDAVVGCFYADWQAGQALPENVPDERFETPAHAMSALAEAGRSQNPTMSWYRDPAKRLPADSDGSSEGPPPA